MEWNRSANTFRPERLKKLKPVRRALLDIGCSTGQFMSGPGITDGKAKA